MKLFYLLFLSALNAYSQPISFLGSSPSSGGGGGYNTPDILGWKGNTGSGTSDPGTPGPNCTLSSSSIWGTTFTPGGSSSDLVFNGTSFSANSASAVTYGVNTMTIEFRINQSSFSTSAPQYYLESGGNNNNGDWWIYNDTDSNSGTIIIRIWDSGGNIASYSIARPSTSTWHHIAIVLNNTGAVAPLAYVDGASVTVTLNSDSRSISTTFSSRTVYYGSAEGTGGYAPASMKDVRIYSGARSAGNVLSDATNYP